MALFDAIRNYLNPTGMKGLPNQYTPGAGFAKNAGGLVDAFMQFQPQYQQMAQGREQLLASRLANQNTPIANAIKNQLMQKQAQQLGIQNQYMPQTLQSEIGLRNAQASNQMADASMAPSKIGLNNAQAGYYNAETNLMPDKLAIQRMQANPMNQMLRYGTANTKEMMMQSMLQQGIDPFSPQGQAMLAQAPQGQPTSLSQAMANQAQPAQQQNTPQMQDNLNTLQMSLQKRNTPAQVMNRNLYATNIEKTLSTIDPNVLAYYSGAGGKARLAQDAALAASGSAPQQYLEYQSLVGTKIPMLTSQVRQFYGDSIQPSVREHLENLGNTATWQDPAVAIKRFNDFAGILGSELQTYRDATKGTSVYRGEQQPVAQARSQTGNNKDAALEELRKRGHKVG